MLFPVLIPKISRSPAVVLEMVTLRFCTSMKGQVELGIAEFWWILRKKRITVRLKACIVECLSVRGFLSKVNYADTNLMVSAQEGPANRVSDEGRDCLS